MLLPGDGNGDGLVTVRDHPSFANCVTGLGGGVLLNCTVFDFDGNSDVDLDDFNTFAQGLSEK